MLLLVPVVSNLAAALRPAARGTDVAVVLDVLDLPPRPARPPGPGLGLRLGQPAARGRGPRARRWTSRSVEPTGDLLDLGTRFRLFRFEAVEVRWERAGAVRRIDPVEYAEAEPDPVHAGRGAAAGRARRPATAPSSPTYLRRQLGLAEQARGPARPGWSGSTATGCVVALGRAGARRRVRLAFPHPVADPADLARLLPPAASTGRRATPAALDSARAPV